MRVVIEADEKYKNMLLEIAQAIKAKITFEENDCSDGLPKHREEDILEGQEQIKQGKVEDVTADYKTKDVTKTTSDEKKDNYDPDFVKMVLESAKQKKGKAIDPKDVWGSLE